MKITNLAKPNITELQTRVLSESAVDPVQAMPPSFWDHVLERLNRLDLKDTTEAELVIDYLAPLRILNPSLLPAHLLTYQTRQTLWRQINVNYNFNTNDVPIDISHVLMLNKLKAIYGNDFKVEFDAAFAKLNPNILTEHLNESNPLETLIIAVDMVTVWPNLDISKFLRDYNWLYWVDEFNKHYNSDPDWKILQSLAALRLLVPTMFKQAMELEGIPQLIENAINQATIPIMEGFFTNQLANLANARIICASEIVHGEFGPECVFLSPQVAVPEISPDRIF